MCHYCALLVNDVTRLNGHAAKGAPVLVSFSFASGPRLAEPGAVPADRTLKSAVRAAVAEAERAAGVRFVEVEPGADPMMSFHYNGDRDGWSWATLPRGDVVDASVTTSVAMNRGYGDYEPGSGGFQVLLHEIGHAMGLKHPHDGATRLPRALDNTNNTLMSYNWRGPDKAEYQALDRAALKALYGPPGALDGVSVLWDGGDDVLTVRGTARGDTIVATNDSVVMHGGDGRDHLVGRGADDTLHGGDGADRLRGFDGADALLGGGRSDRLWGGWHDDRLIGEGGHDRLFGEEGRDLLRGGLGRDTLSGGPDADRLLGGGGADRLFGNAGDDRLDGGPGADWLAGGPGADIFVLRPGQGADTIADFDPAQGDRLNVRAFGLTRAEALDRIATSDADLLFDNGNGWVRLDRAAGDGIAGSDFIV